MRTRLPSPSGFVAELLGPTSDVRATASLELVLALQRGERAAQALVYERYAPYVERILLRTLGPDPELPDMLHEVFVAAFASAESLRDPLCFRGWLAKIAVHTSHGLIRRRMRARWFDFRRVAPPPVPALDDEVGDLARATLDVLGKLTPELRIPFVLRYVEGMELREVAEACDCSLATIKRRLDKAEERFRRLSRTHPVLAEAGLSFDGEAPAP